MQTVIYDNTFYGFLTAVFEIYEYRFRYPHIQKNEFARGSIFSAAHTVYTNQEKAGRVLKKLKQKLSPQSLRMIYHCFLSDIPGIENNLFRYIKYALKSNENIEADFTNQTVLQLQKVNIKVGRESHRMLGFIRFQQSADNLFFSVIEPDHNVLPLITTHFKNRYSCQRWLIYDTKRKYGIYYDLKTLQEINISSQAGTHGLSIALHENELLCQQLWKNYFKRTNNAARKNTKLHIQFLPKRYWKHLTEKSV